MSTLGCAPERWAPHFADYLYVSFTNATAFSPTDTMPLTQWAKILMLTQALTSLLTSALVAARGQYPHLRDGEPAPPVRPAHSQSFLSVASAFSQFVPRH